MQMSAPNYLSVAVAGFLYQLPVFIACVAGLIITVASWRKSPSASLWASLGFGLALALCILVPVGQQIVFQLVQGEAVARAKMNSALNLFWSMLRAASYVLLLIAVYTGRRESAPR